MAEMTRISLRVPKDLRDWLEAQADASYRNLNGQVIYLLEQARQGACQQKRPAG